MKKFLAIFVFIMLTACSGEQSGHCIPGDGSETASGKKQNSPEAIFEYVKERKIISTTIDKIKDMLIGTSPINFEFGPFKYSPGAGAAQNMFTAISSNPTFTSAIGAAFSLAIIFYGVGVATGIIQVTLGDAVIRIGKILAVAYIATNWTLFYELVGSFFITVTDEIIGYMLQNFGGLYAQGPSFSAGFNTNMGAGFGFNLGGAGVTGTGLFSVNSANNLFADIDLFFANIFSVHTYAIMSALISPFGKNAGPYSNIYALFLLFSLFQMITGILKVVLIYAFSLFAKALLFALAPIFFTFMLFNATKHLFDAWLKLQINFTLQPIFVMSFVGLFISALSPLYKELYDLKVCYGPLEGDKHGWYFQTEEGRAHASSVSDTPPIKLQTLLMMFFFSWLFKSYLGLAEQLASSITQSVGGNLAHTANAVAQNLGMGGGQSSGGNTSRESQIQQLNANAQAAKAQSAAASRSGKP